MGSLCHLVCGVFCWISSPRGAVRFVKLLLLISRNSVLHIIPILVHVSTVFTIMEYSAITKFIGDIFADQVSAGIVLSSRLHVYTSTLRCSQIPDFFLPITLPFSASCTSVAVKTTISLRMYILDVASYYDS